MRAVAAALQVRSGPVPAQPLELLAVRHGQASLQAEDYDQLSAIGRAQAEALGDWIGRRGLHFDCVLCGDMRRHRQTLDGIAAGLGRHGLALPEVRIDPRLNEFDHRRLASTYATRCPGHPGAQALVERTARDPRRVLELLRDALLAWSRDELPDAGEPWTAFKARARAALEDLSAGPHGSVLLVSSAGVIAQLAAAASGLTDAQCIALKLSLRNSALCRIAAARGTLRLLDWNGLPHLAHRRDLWTQV